MWIPLYVQFVVNCSYRNLVVGIAFKNIDELKVVRIAAECREIERVVWKICGLETNIHNHSLQYIFKILTLTILLLVWFIVFKYTLKKSTSIIL